VCHRPGNPNRAEAKTKHPWRVEGGTVTGGLVKRAGPAMMHAYFEYMTSGYPRGAGHGMLLVQLHGPAAGQPWAPVGARRMLAPTGAEARRAWDREASRLPALLYLGGFDAAGAGACLPENSGGTGGFADLKEVLVGPPGQAREEMRAWAGEDYAPERLNLDAANAAVAAI
jgi:hypothetical protein